MASPPSKLDLARLADVLKHLRLVAAAKAAIPAGATPSIAFDTLAAAGFIDGALSVAAYCLPKREAVWWACMCADATAPVPRDDADAAIARATQDWVRRPSDEAGRRAFALAEEHGQATAECWCAVAAHWSGNSLAPPDQPAVPPATHLPGLAVMGAISLCSVRTNAQYTLISRAFIQSALEISLGGAGRIKLPVS